MVDASDQGPGSGEREESTSPAITRGQWAAATILAGMLGVGLGVSAYHAVSGHAHTARSGYVGPRRCGECHPEQADSWARTRMARSFEVLRAGVRVDEKKLAGIDPTRDYTHDDACLPCHTTGYGRAGGFVSIEKTPEMAGVTCEACHGAGGMYIEDLMSAKEPTFDTKTARAAGLIYPPTARVCRGCHNEDSPFAKVGYEFDYTERVKQGTHDHFPLKYDHGR